MTAGLYLYRLLTSLFSLFADQLIDRRIAAGKEDGARRHERFALDLPQRPAGTLIWLHGASVGETQLLNAIGKAMLERRPGLTLLFTSQTLTSARLLAKTMPDGAIHQMAPVDTPGATRRFLEHWTPNLLVVAEGEIWPNMLMNTRKAGVPALLINARMTEKSLKGWRRWRGAAKALMGVFGTILAADEKTAQGLSGLLQRDVTSPGNIKAALPPPPAEGDHAEAIRAAFLAGKKCLVAASTHEGEEALVIDALQQSGADMKLILAPRHPERGSSIAALLKERGVAFVQRSTGEEAGPGHTVLLADTLGEMGLWYSLADVVYLGGGHAPGVGGHNPIEPVMLGKPVMSGPDVFNFEDIFSELEAAGAVQMVENARALAAALLDVPQAPDADALAAFKAKSRKPMDATLEAIFKHLPEAAR